MYSENPHPNFFIVGAAKGGTTSLHAYISQHPQVYMSPIKETNYFSQADMRPELFNHEYRQDTRLNLPRYLSGTMEKHVHIANVEHREDYIRLFHGVRDEKAIGEASTSYLYCPSAAARISEAFPEARVVAILRNPVERAFSHYLMNLRLGKTLDTDFIREVEADYQLVNKGWGVSRLYLDLGLYSEQVKRYQEHFPAEHVHIIVYDDYRANPGETMSALCRFLGIDEQVSMDLSRKHNAAGVPRLKYLNYILTQSGAISAVKRIVPGALKQQLKSLMYSDKSVPEMDARARARLEDFYREDITQLGDLLNRDLSGWLAN
ncbi:sulfotransferase family protein [Thiogranum longum]|uniref:Sulfotransferase family protein n=1 Tax=Thiogranum longum TaxID=1537524 RepID=A0A4R1HDE3_9GAMM|nr:sulfotransferase [Thiogranum longum]TCK18170.1 sulfotransferase family protein [Thiogranum longum]